VLFTIESIGKFVSCSFFDTYKNVMVGNMGFEWRGGGGLADF
jgi:hypothetical protein